jgi:hypothetical protein
LPLCVVPPVLELAAVAFFGLDVVFFAVFCAKTDAPARDNTMTTARMILFIIVLRWNMRSIADRREQLQ